jgi:hypothetical protein
MKQAIALVLLFYVIKGTFVTLLCYKGYKLVRKKNENNI